MNNRRNFIVRILTYLLPISFFLIIWIPLITHYHVENITITDEMVTGARDLPPDSVLNEILGFFQSPGSMDRKKIVDYAESIMNGSMPISRFKKENLKLPFDKNDIDKGSPGWQLFLASFGIPDLFLKAYEISKRDDFLMMAKDIIHAWALYERKALIPRGLLWNDHAISARIAVITRFWKIYRHHPLYDRQVARDILLFVARSAELLSKPSHFTYSTNHGIMQNLALLQICIAFPTIPGVDHYKSVALERLKDQMTYYVNDEGVVLEHSAGYQKAGIEFLGMAFRYLTLAGMSIPDEWTEKYEKAKLFYSQLRRPDGSLPMYGDTNEDEDKLGPLVTKIVNGTARYLYYQKEWTPQKTHSLYPVAGYSIWWDELDKWPDEQKLSQTVIIWSYFPGHAHKHADEMSVLLWAGGQTWWTGAGYWPYGAKGRAEAVSWNGSNAPHLTNEDKNSVRFTKLLSYGWSDNLSAIELERKGPDEYIAHRQVIHIKPDIWVVVDNTSGNKNERTTTIWTTSSYIKMKEGTIPGSYILVGKNGKISLTAFIITSDKAEVKRYKGSYKPFAGWAGNKPADALAIEQPAENSWSAMIWHLKSPGSTIQIEGKPYMKKWNGPDSWKLVLPVKSGLFRIGRNGDNIRVEIKKSGNISTKGLPLMKAPSTEDKYLKIRAAYKATSAKYPPKFKDHLSYRLKATYLIVFIFVLQEAFFFIYRRLEGKYQTRFVVISIFGWIIMILSWVTFLYYKA